MSNFRPMSVPRRPQSWPEPFRNARDLSYKQFSDLVKPVKQIPARLLHWLLPTNNDTYDVHDADHPRTFLEPFLRAQVHHLGTNEWEPYSVLGEGSFGKVGLWRRQNTSGVVVDELAVKETQHMAEYTEGNFRATGFSKEAVIQAQLNEHRCENILHLRGYALLTNDTAYLSSDKITQMAGAAQDKPKYLRCRMYTEYAPYGSLSQLAMQYRAWDQYLPEVFLWHVFDCLATAVSVMDDGPKRKFGAQIIGRNEQWDPNHGVIHFDMHSSNVMLGYETPLDTSNPKNGGTTSKHFNFPMIKVMDFGESCITGPADWPDPNPLKLWDQGAPYFMPPEQVHYGCNWNPAPNSTHSYPSTAVIASVVTYLDPVRAERNNQQIDFNFDNSFNIWQMGKTMYDLATLSDGDDFERLWTPWQHEYENWSKDKGHMIQEFQALPFRQAADPENIGGYSGRRSPYSPDLMQLIRRCLHPAMRARPSAADVKQVTSSSLNTFEQYHDQRVQGMSFTTEPENDPSLYYYENDINNMPLGRTPFEKREDELDALMYSQDPSKPPLDPPDQKWRDEKQTYATHTISGASPDQTVYRIDNGRIVFSTSPTGSPGNSAVPNTATPTQTIPPAQYSTSPNAIPVDPISRSETTVQARADIPLRSISSPRVSALRTAGAAAAANQAPLPSNLSPDQAVAAQTTARGSITANTQTVSDSSAVPQAPIPQTSEPPGTAQNLIPLLAPMPIAAPAATVETDVSESNEKTIMTTQAGIVASTSDHTTQTPIDTLSSSASGPIGTLRQGRSQRRQRQQQQSRAAPPVRRSSRVAARNQIARENTTSAPSGVSQIDTGDTSATQASVNTVGSAVRGRRGARRGGAGNGQTRNRGRPRGRGGRGDQNAGPGPGGRKRGRDDDDNDGAGLAATGTTAGAKRPRRNGVVY